MGGGASSQGLEEVLTETFQLGRQLVAVSFPGMYRIYDFHSRKAPRIKNSAPFSMLCLMDSDDEEEEEQGAIVSTEYESLFNVKVGNDTVYFEDVNEVNDAGWTALHTCCMSYQTVDAGLNLIKEMTRLHGSLDVKTVTGPGAFNSGWSPLHMACAYGVEPLVTALIENDVNVDTTNSYNVTPLLEACHRGFGSIVKLLCDGGADLSYNPSSRGSSTSPFVSSPSQAALAESARCGFNTIVQLLVDAGANKDQTNHLGWTALHEAAFYNRIEVVRILLYHGANPSLRTKCGALPWHLAGLNAVREMIKDMGGDDAVPADDDTIDMMMVMRELTIGTDKKQKMMVFTIDPETGRPVLHEMEDDEDDDEEEEEAKGDEEGEELSAERERVKVKSKKSPGKFKTPTKEAKESKDDSDAKETSLLHSGGVLGDLPGLPGSGGSNGKVLASNKKNADFNNSMEAAIEGNATLSDMMANHTNSTPVVGKSKGKKSKKRQIDASVPADMPREFLCNLTQKQLSDPVRTPYGNVYERAVILDWFKNQGHLCPMTGKSFTVVISPAMPIPIPLTACLYLCSFLVISLNIICIIQVLHWLRVTSRMQKIYAKPLPNGFCSSPWRMLHLPQPSITRLLMIQLLLPRWVPLARSVPERVLRANRRVQRRQKKICMTSSQLFLDI